MAQKKIPFKLPKGIYIFFNQYMIEKPKYYITFGF